MCGDSRRRFRNGSRIRVSRAETESRIISAAVYFKRDKVLSDTQWSIKVMISSFAVFSRNVNPGVGRVTVRQELGNWILVFRAENVILTGNCDGKSQDIRETRRYRGARLRECRTSREREKIKSRM